MTDEHTYSRKSRFGRLYLQCSCGWRRQLTARPDDTAVAEWHEHRRMKGLKREHYLDVGKNRNGEDWMWCGPHWEFRLEGTTFQDGLQEWEAHKRRTGDDCNGW